MFWSVKPKWVKRLCVSAVFKKEPNAPSSVRTNLWLPSNVYWSFYIQRFYCNSRKPAEEVTLEYWCCVSLLAVCHVNGTTPRLSCDGSSPFWLRILRLWVRDVNVHVLEVNFSGSQKHLKGIIFLFKGYKGVKRAATWLEITLIDMYLEWNTAPRCSQRPSLLNLSPFSFGVCRRMLLLRFTSISLVLDHVDAMSALGSYIV